VKRAASAATPVCSGCGVVAVCSPRRRGLGRGSPTISLPETGPRHSQASYKPRLLCGDESSLLVSKGRDQRRARPRLRRARFQASSAWDVSKGVRGCCLSKRGGGHDPLLSLPRGRRRARRACSASPTEFNGGLGVGDHGSKATGDPRHGALDFRAGTTPPRVDSRPPAGRAKLVGDGGFRGRRETGPHPALPD